jgi:acetyl-CoA carboxylase biotin carboxyl carrier protein
MPGPFRALSDDEVRQIGLLIESLDRSTFDYLQLEFGDVKLMIGKGAPPEVAATDGAAATPIAPAQSAAPASTASRVADGAGASVVAAKTEAADGLTVTAPMVGRFYAQPEPGAAPFVTVGSEVTEDTTVAIIEVMKMFNAVPAGVRGVIAEVCVQDSQFVEYGQALFRVRAKG